MEYSRSGIMLLRLSAKNEDGWSDESSKAQRWRDSRRREGGRKYTLTYPPIYLPIYLSTYLPTYLSIYILTYTYLDQSRGQLLAHVQGHRVTVGGELISAGVEGHEEGQQLLHGGPESLHPSMMMMMMMMMMMRWSLSGVVK
jgi:hypothetical protein